MTEIPEENAGSVLRFEQALEQLQAAVRRLEGGSLELEEALRCFEEGVRLTRLCQQQLTVAEQKVEVLMKSASGEDEPNLQPFTGNRS